MKNIKINYLKIIILTAIISIVSASCERNLADDATLSTNSKNGEVFIDGFSAGLAYGAFGGSKYTAFTVDTEVKYEGSSSMRFDIPSVGDPNGAYAGGVFIDGSGRNLTDFDALTFWVKGSQAASLNSVGLGIDFGLNKYKVEMNNVSIGTNWQKVIIPMPDPSKLIQEKGMFWYSEGPENGLGYTFWMDNVKYERLGTIAHQTPSILNGIDKVEQTFIGSSITLSGLTDTFNMPSGFNQTVTLAASYFKFISTDTSVATVSELGLVSVVGSGTCDIKATMAGIPATGSLKINSLGVFTPAPTPTQNAANVISIFSNAFTNIPVEYYNGYYAPYQTTQGQADVKINGDDIIKYSQFNFVGIQFTQPTVDASQMTHFHIDLKVQNTTGARNSFKVSLNDFGTDNAYGGGNDTSLQFTYNNAALASGSWVSLDLPISGFTGTSNRMHFAQIILESAAGITDLLVDNIYLYAVTTAPTVAAPTPSLPAANVISVFSDAYTDIAANLNPGWGQATVVTQAPIAGNNTLKYTGLNYQGIEFGANQNLSTMTKLHIDYYSANSTSLKTYLISPGPVEKAKVLTVPTTAGWNSLEIPLTDFSPVNLANVFQMKFDGNGTIYLDNIYFHN
ncbi:MAG: glycosyl hydrolase family 16 [Flavobacterium sp.]|nr:glycosyl hydrolase family 16 [Flavobacterium sp.]